MNPTRRDFIRYVGITLAGLVVRSCGATCYTPGPDWNRPALAPSELWAGLRECWFRLGDPQLQSFTEADFSRDLREPHRLMLDELVQAGKMDARVAEQIQIAFDQAIIHIQRQTVECYEAFPVEYYPRQDLAQQRAALEEMAGKSGIDPATVEQAQEALARDIAWLDDFQAGWVPGALEEVEPDPAAVEAARILVELLLGKKE